MSDISLKLSVDIEGAIKNISEFTKKSSQTLGNLEKGLKGIEGAFEKIGDAAGAIGSFKAFEILSKSITTVVAASSEAEKSLKLMENSLKLSGDYSVSASESFQDFANEIQRLTKFDDDLILSQVAVAKQFGASNVEAKKMIRAAADLAEATEGDLAGAMTELGKSLDGTAGRLAEKIPGLRQFTEEELRAGAAIDYVSSRFGGSAQSSTKIFSGAMTQAKNAISNLVEAVGDLITKNQGIVEMIRSFTQLISTITESKSLLALISTLGGILLAITALTAGFFAYTAIVKAAAVASAFLGVSLSAALGPISLAITAVGALGAALGYAFSKANQSPVERVSDNLEAARNRVESLTQELERLEKYNNSSANSSGSFYSANSPDKNAAVKIKAELEDARESLRKLESSSVSMTKKIGPQISESLTGPLKRALIAQKEKYNKHLDKLKDEFEKLKEKLDEIGMSDKDKINKKYNFEQLKINELYKNKRISEEEFQEYSIKLAKEKQEIILEFEKKRFQELANNPFPSMLNGSFSGGKDAAAAGLYGVNQALNGKEGARQLISSAAGAIADKFLPGSGEVVSQIVNELSKGPEHAKKMIDEFMKAIPELLKNIALAFPEVFKGLARNIGPMFKELVKSLPEIVESMVQMMPDVMIALIETLPDFIDAMIQIGPRMFEGMFRGLDKLFSKIFGDGAKQFINDLLRLPEEIINAIIRGIEEGVKGIGDSLNPVKGGVVLGGEGKRGGFENAIGIDLPGFFAKGGVVPGGYPNDSYPAMLTSGELVVPTNQVKSYVDFMRSTGAMQSGVTAPNLLNTKQSNSAPTQDQTLIVNVQIEQKTLAQAILNINRSGLRTA